MKCMYIFVTGGVISSMGAISSSIRALLKGVGLHITLIIVDSYLFSTFNEPTHIVCTMCRLPFLDLGFHVRSSELFGSFL